MNLFSSSISKHKRNVSQLRRPLKDISQNSPQIDLDGLKIARKCCTRSHWLNRKLFDLQIVWATFRVQISSREHSILTSGNQVLTPPTDNGLVYNSVPITTTTITAIFCSHNFIQKTKIDNCSSRKFRCNKRIGYCSSAFLVLKSYANIDWRKRTIYGDKAEAHNHDVIRLGEQELKCASWILQKMREHRKYGFAFSPWF